MLWFLLAVAATGAFQCVVIVGLCYVVKREHRQKVDVLQACRAVLVEHRKHEEETACKMRALQLQTAILQVCPSVFDAWRKHEEEWRIEQLRLGSLRYTHARG